MKSKNPAILVCVPALIAIIGLRPVEGAEGWVATTQGKIQDLNNQQTPLKHMRDCLEQIARETQLYTEALQEYIAGVVLQGAVTRETGAAEAARAADQNIAVQRELKARFAVTTQQISEIQAQIDAINQALKTGKLQGQEGPGDMHVPPIGCSFAGTWSNDLSGVGFSTWTITDDGNARERGLAGATGRASLDGTILTIEWTRPGDFAGAYLIELNATCSSGQGTMHLTLLPPGATPLMAKSFFTRH